MTVGSVINAVAILRYLARSKPQGVNAIARALAVSPSSCFGILKTLVAEGFLDFDPLSKTYRIGALPAQLFSAPRGLEQWRQWLEERTRDFAGKHLICTGIWQLRSDRVELLHVADSPLDTRIHLSVGQRLPSHIGAMGRCIAARERLSPEELRQIVETLRWQDPPILHEYQLEVQAAAQDGWAFDEGRYIRGVTTVATTIAGPSGEIQYCLSASTFSGQLNRVNLSSIGSELAELARDAEARLGEAPGPPSGTRTISKGAN